MAMDSLEKAKGQATEVLREAITLHLFNKDYNKLGMALGMGNLDPSFVGRVIIDNYDAERMLLDTDIVVATIIDELRSDFRLPELRELHVDLTRTSSEAELQSFDAHAELVFYTKVLGLSYLVKYYDQDIATINQYRSILLAKQRQLAKFSKWGDVDNSDWLTYIQEFAIEKLFCGSVETAIMALHEHVRSHANSVWMGPCGRALIIHCLFADGKGPQALTGTGHPTHNYDAIETGEDFEHYIKELLQENIKGVTVELTPKTGDQGADLIVCGPNSKIVIQAKYYSGKVGNTAVQEVTAAKAYYHADVSVVVTNSGYTDSARSLAEKTNTVLCSTDSFIPHIKLLTQVNDGGND